MVVMPQSIQMDSVFYFTCFDLRPRASPTGWRFLGSGGKDQVVGSPSGANL